MDFLALWPKVLIFFSANINNPPLQVEVTAAGALFFSRLHFPKGKHYETLCFFLKINDSSATFVEALLRGRPSSADDRAKSSTVLSRGVLGKDYVL